MLDPGLNLAPRQYEAGFMRAAHSLDDLDHPIEAARKAYMSL
jgi:glutamate-1-semialdehyde 2,1-aminomutase